MPKNSIPTPISELQIRTNEFRRAEIYPYSYTSNNPIIRIDADGKIRGSAENGRVKRFGAKRLYKKRECEERALGRRYELRMGVALDTNALISFAESKVGENLSQRLASHK